MEEALLAQIAAVADTSDADPEYRSGLRPAVRASLEHSFAVIERREPEPPPVPAILLTQARLAARHSIGLDIVLRRYVAGSALIDDFILSEVHASECQDVLRARATALKQLLADVTDEYEDERVRRSRDREARRLNHIRNLIRGEPADPEELGYPLQCHHTAMVAKGPDAAPSIRCLAKQLDSSILLVRSDQHTTWAWLGSRRAFDRSQLCEVVRDVWKHRAPLALGDPAHGLAGWRQSHREATAALLVAERAPNGVSVYSDVCLPAAAMQDPVLEASLRSLYLVPLEEEPDQGARLRETLRAYFSCRRNGKATAATLGISRQAVASRLKAIEDRVGRPLSSNGGAFETALQLHELSNYSGASSRTCQPNRGS